MINLTDLKAKAEAATQGRWYQCGPPWFNTGSGVLAGSPDPHAGFLIVDTEEWNGERAEYAENNPDGVAIADAEADAAYIAAASPADMLPLINALIEWRDAYQAWSSADSAARLGLASDALFALIGGEPTQETTP